VGEWRDEESLSHLLNIDWQVAPPTTRADLLMVCPSFYLLIDLYALKYNIIATIKMAGATHD
jgi:hypothetical protein